MFKLRALLLLFTCCCTLQVTAQSFDFSLHKIESAEPGPTMLVIGGIQGDEPGGFTAASLLVTNYQIQRGNLWVVPNLNFESILKRSRGVYGDMNRKFKNIAEDDPEYQLVNKIKKIILHEKVDLVLNLHDGSGFYRDEYIDKWHNPGRWGQSIIIDQEKIAVPKYGNLQEMANSVAQYINSKIELHNNRFTVKNTNTRAGDKEMEKTLTYFAINHQTPAFGIEASKNFLTHERAYFHLLAVEGYMSALGISFQRDFELAKAQVKENIGKNLQISMFDNRIRLEVDNARKLINYLPVKIAQPLSYQGSNPLLAVLGDKRKLNVRYGNRHITMIKPQFFPYDDSLQSVAMQIDGKVNQVRIGSKVTVRDNFKVLADNEFRVNVIGYNQSGIKDENRILINKNKIMSRFSLDQDARLFRIEFYKDTMFSGMILVNFVSEQTADSTPMQIPKSYDTKYAVGLNM